MKREYVQWFSPALRKNMELLVFGHSGASVLFFPTRKGRFYEYEDRGIIGALGAKIENGHLKVFCVDSVDGESYYNSNCHPYHKMLRYLQYERYIMDEVIPFIQWGNHGSYMISAGCSMGAYHAVNIALRHPDVFNKTIGMSGRYDLTRQMDHYPDLLNGYWDENVYFNMPAQYIPNLTDPVLLEKIRKQEIIFAAGREDIFFQSNEYLNDQLWKKGIKSTLYAWDHEAHSARYWRKMVSCYL